MGGIYLHYTNLGITEGQSQAVVLENGSIILHSSDGHLSRHSEPPGSKRARVTGEESHHVKRLPGVIERTTYLQIQIVHAVSIAEDDGSRWRGLAEE